MRLVSTSEAETRRIAAELARKIVKKKATGSALVVALKGDLGSGKTVFAKGFLRALGVRKVATSPTFTIIKRYPLINGRVAFHMDAYRIKSPSELKHIGFKELFNDSKNLILIEWPERIGKNLPRLALTIKFLHKKKDRERTIVI